MTLLLALALLGLGAWVALDAVAVGQFMVSRPLVAATLAGALAGEVWMGALVGAILELLHLAHIPAGGARLPEPGPGAVVAGAVAALLVGEGVRPGNGGLPPGAALAFALTLGVLLSGMAGRLVARHREGTARRIEALLAREESRTLRGRDLGVLVPGTLLRDAARGAGLTVGGLGVAALFPAAALAAWPLELSRTLLLLAVPALLGLGAVASVPVPGRRSGLVLLVLGLLAGVGVGVAVGGLGGAQFPAGWGPP
jgi:mannose/fructose/N-acetylgalactosamine-specific phosphotransferase system component IIC